MVDTCISFANWDKADINEAEEQRQFGNENETNLIKLQEV